MTAPTTTTLRPGYLVSLSVRVSGGVRYERTDGPTQTAPDGTETATWTTTRHTADPAEVKRAEQARGEIRHMIAKTCTRTSFGLLCPTSAKTDLDSAIEAARAKAAEVNATLQHAEISVNVLCGRIAESDTQAERAIRDELRAILDDVRSGVLSGNAAEIRAACSRARDVARAIDESAAQHVTRAIEEARAIARAIVRRVETGGETIEAVLSEHSTRSVDAARAAFLDLSDATEAPIVAMPQSAAPQLDTAEPDPAEERARALSAIAQLPVMDCAPPAGQGRLAFL